MGLFIQNVMLSLTPHCSERFLIPSSPSDMTQLFYWQPCVSPCLADRFLAIGTLPIKALVRLGERIKFRQSTDRPINTSKARDGLNIFSLACLFLVFSNFCFFKTIFTFLFIDFPFFTSLFSMLPQFIQIPFLSCFFI